MMADDPDKAPLIERIMHHLARTHVGVRGETLPMEHAAKDAWTTAFMERFEQEMAPYAGPLLEHLLDNPELPDPLRNILEQARAPGHQITGILQIVILVASLPFTIGTLAAPFIQNVLNVEWSKSQFVPLSPQELAVAVNKGWISFADAADQAALSGLSESRFATLQNATGLPPGPETLLTMWQRGIITADRLVQGIEQSNLRVEWASSLEALALGPLSAQQAIIGVVQNHLDQGSAETVLRQNGIDPSNYDVLYQNAGRPPGPEQMLNAWNRGAAGVTQATVEQAVRESDIKDKYVPVIVGLREHLLPQKTIVAGVHQGVIDDATALAELLKLGISAQNAGFLIAEGHNNKVATHKNLSVAQIEAAYEDGSLTRADAQTHLVALNYLAADATFILDLVDVKWQQALHNATVSRVRANYVNGHTTRTVASNELDTAGVSSAHRDLYLTQWDIVRATPTRTLTQAQAQRAYQRGLITETVYRTRLTSLGYAPADVDLLVALEPVHLTQAQVLAAFTGGFIDEQETRDRLTDLGLATADQNILIGEKAPPAPGGGA
jgi:hypothetical protein